nr:hypothetical protein [Tanacetum cinerariifolium]GEZ95187.1 hypothetical protein [Tanacetum cinerariifolium]
MLNKENYVPWSSCLIRYAKSRPNEKLIYNSIINGPYVRRMILEPDIYAVVDGCETAQEIWLCVQQMKKYFDIGIQEKKATLFNEWEMFTSTDRESIESYYHQWSRHVTIVHQTKELYIADYTQLYDFLKYNKKENGLIVVSRNANQNPNGNGNVLVARAKGNVIRNNGNQIRSYNCRGSGHLARNCTVKYLYEIKEVNVNCILMANLQQASTSGTQTDKAPVYDSDGSAKRLYNGKVLLEKHDPPVVYDSEKTLKLAQESRFKMKQLNKQIKPANYTKINHLSGVFVSQAAKSGEELYFSNISKTANVPKRISIPNEEFSDDTTPGVARKFLNKVKSTNLTLQHVAKQKMTLDIHNWSSSVHQEIYKIVKDEIFPIINQVDARLQNFKIQFLKEASKFVLDFKSLAKEADESLAKHKALELEIKRLLRAVVNQDTMSIVQNNSVVDTSNLQTKLERTKERFENCIIKKE